MTHLGDHLGFPATGQEGTLDGSSFLIVKDNQVMEGWNQMDLGAPHAEAPGKLTFYICHKRGALISRNRLDLGAHLRERMEFRVKNLFSQLSIPR